MRAPHIVHPIHAASARRLGLAAWLVVLAATLVAAGCGTQTSSGVTMGEEAYARGDLASAITHYDMALEAHPDDLAVRTRLAVMLLEQGEALAADGRYALANERFERAFEVGGTVVQTPEHLVALADIREAAGMGWPAQAQPLERAAADAPDLDVLRRLAYGYDLAGDRERAAEAMQALLELDPSDTRVLLRWAQLEEALGHEEVARSGYEKLLAFDPSSVVGRLALASLLETTGDSAGAEQLYRAVASENPDHLGAWKALHRFYQRQGDTEALTRIEATMREQWPDTQPKKRPLR